MGRYRDKKFKAWDNEKKEWFSPIYEGYNNKIFEILISLKGSLIIRNEGFEINGHKGNTIHESCFPNRFELVQYTGLKDKNGKEIYEGDILRHINPKPFKNSVYEVVFLNGGFAIKGDDYIEDLNEFLKGSSSAEVIGNIYENPELLEGEE